MAPTIRDFPLEENFIRQGITTIIASLHSTDQPWPLAPYMDRLKMAPNVAFFAGHTWIRKKVMGLDNRTPTAAELASMKAMVDQSMRDGALGLATGLEYVPATYSTTEEIIELAKVASRHGGIYVSHVRNEDVDSLKSMDEIIRIAREAKIPVQVNHHKVAGAAQFGMSVKTLAMVDQARAAGLDVKIDVYPYTAFSTFAYYDPAMSLYSVRLDEAGEEALAAAARAPKVSRAVILREAIAEYASVAGREVSPRIRMSSLIGVIEDGPGNLSEQTGKGFARILDARRATRTALPSLAPRTRAKRTGR